MADKNPKFTDGAIKFTREFDETMNAVCMGIAMFCIGNEMLTDSEKVTLVRNLLAAAINEIGASMVRHMPEAVYADLKPTNSRVPQPSIN